MRVSKTSDMTPMATDEVERIRAEYTRREESLPKDFYSLSRPANLFAHQQRNRELLQLLNSERLIPLDGKKILDVGCGDGQQLLNLESWGARPADLAGIDLIESRLARAVARFGGREPEERPELRVGDASRLPWPDGTFDMAHQSAVFTSITDIGMKSAVAREIVRVLKPGGVMIWYDFLFQQSQESTCPRNWCARNTLPVSRVRCSTEENHAGSAHRPASGAYHLDWFADSGKTVHLQYALLSDDSKGREDHLNIGILTQYAGWRARSKHNHDENRTESGLVSLAYLQSGVCVNVEATIGAPVAKGHAAGSLVQNAA